MCTTNPSTCTSVLGPVVPPKEKAIMVEYLAQGHKFHDQDSNPHFADQKHQSLSPVLFTARLYTPHVATVCPWFLSQTAC